MLLCPYIEESALKHTLYSSHILSSEAVHTGDLVQLTEKQTTRLNLDMQAGNTVRKHGLNGWLLYELSHE